MHTCFIIPEHILSSIVSQNRASAHVLEACRSTIDRNNQIRQARIHHGQEIAASMRQQQPQHQRPEGIIPRYVHSNIAEHSSDTEPRQAAVGTMQHDDQHSAAAAKSATLKRTIYDAQHSWNQDNPPRNKILIKEGGPLISQKADPSQDPNEAYIGFKKTYDFYQKFFQRNSIDGRGLPLNGFVHFGQKYQNAFWDGKEMIFGDGDGTIFLGFTDELDVIGHELTHGVTQYTCPLDYQDQAGALNESLSDCFGIMVKQWGQNPDKPQTAAEADWLIGEGIWGPTIKGKALRSMKAPGTAYDDPQVGKDPQPATWAGYDNTTDDNGGVHINSGIPNHAFYLAATNIGGYAWEGAGQIWYKAMKSGQVKQNSTFKEFADVTIANAGSHKDAVQKAWNDVGYPFDSSSTGTTAQKPVGS